MGEVYRARDTKLNRDVALKVLPDSFASDHDRLARFTREAQTLASLNHPTHRRASTDWRKAAVVRALVIELVDGDGSARERIARGAIPLDEALSIARQIAEALAAAHERGIVHRDLKPANIKLRPDGVVKVLDFGLAKALEPAQGSGLTAQGDVANSPTITSPAMTEFGVILGTAAYMSPEQARGRPIDKRTDIWAFGCVLYEMLTGKRAFERETVSDTLAAVLGGSPDWTTIGPRVPASVRLLMHQCLRKRSHAEDCRHLHGAVRREPARDGGPGREPDWRGQQFETGASVATPRDIGNRGITCGRCRRMVVMEPRRDSAECGSIHLRTVRALVRGALRQRNRHLSRRYSHRLCREPGC